MIPVAIATPGGDCFGAYAPAAGPAVLFCPGFGYEALSTYRVWRDFAARLAGEGSAVLRLDLPGTGDSAGDADQAQPVAAWRGAIDAGVAWLRERHGSVTLLGCRFGALLALDAMGRGTGCDALVLLDPPADGRGMLRQLRARARMEASDDPGGAALQAYGMPLTEGLLTALGALPAMGATAPAVLLLQDAPASVPGWRLALEGAGVRIETAPFPERDAFVMRDSFRLEPPREAFGRVSAFLLARRSARESDLVPPSGVRSGGVQEEPVWFGPGLFGIVSQPEGTRTIAVLIPSVGNLPRSGTGRTMTDLARRLASSGFASFRYDCAAAGESAGEPGGDPSVETYLPYQVDQVSMAVDVLAARGYERVVVIGHCSSAYLGWHAAGVDHRIVGLFLVNLQIFQRMDAATAVAIVRPGMTQEAAPRSEATAAPGLRDRVQRLCPRPVWDFLRAMTPTERAVRRHLRRLVRRGCRVQLVFGDEEDESWRFHRAFGRPARLPPGAAMTVVAGADHTFTALRHRSALLDLAAGFVASHDNGGTNDRG